MISRRVSQTQSPPLVELGDLASKTKDCISLGQGAPYYYPPEWIFENFRYKINNHEIHRYSPDPGIKEFKQKLVNKLLIDNGLTVKTDEIVITPGANQAFFNTLLTISDAGDEIILLGPYYFNHKMASGITNVNSLEIPLEKDFSISYERLDAAISKKTKAIVLVNPGNPTGAVHSREDIKVLHDLSKKYDILIIADETYEYFTYGNTKHIPAASIIDDNIISIGSFSKTYGIPGWRLGYYFASSDIIDQSLTVQDTIGICAPNPSQVLGIDLLDNRDQLIPKFVSMMENNYQLASDLIEDIPWLKNQPSKGAYYLFPSQSTGIKSIQLSKRLIREYGVYIVPGDGFGNAGKNHFRLSFANVKDKSLKEAFERLRSFHP